MDERRTERCIRAGLTAGLGLAAALLLAGCGLLPPTGPAAVDTPAGTDTPHPTTASPTPRATATPSTFGPRRDDVDGGDWEGQPSTSSFASGPRTVIGRGADSSYRIYGADHATIGLVAPRKDSDRDVESTRFGAQQKPTAPSGLIVATVERKHANGLTPGGTVLALRSYDDVGAPRHSVEVATPDDTLLGSVALYGDTAVIATNGDHDVDVYRAVDTASGSTLWSTSCPGRDYSSDPVVGATGIWVIACITDALAGVEETRGVDIATGATRWAVSRKPHALSGGSILAIPGSGTLYATYGYDTYDIGTGAQVSSSSQEFPLVDERRGLLVTRDGGGLQTTELSTRSRVFTLSKDDADRLQGLKVFGLVDGRLWSWSDGDVGVSDARSGTTDPLTPPHGSTKQTRREFPVAVGDTWALLGTVDGLGDIQLTGIWRDPTGAFTATALSQVSR